MRTAAFVLATLLLASCGTGSSMGDLGDIILGSPSSTQSSDVRGYVESVDTYNRSITLDVAYINNLRQSDSNQRGTIYYDNDTRVIFEAREYRVTDLERGDEIEIRGANVGGRYVADTITVVRDVSR